MRKKSMKENAILNALRTLAGIVFPLITYPYISRVLGADNLGKINFANSIVSYFSLLAALGISSYAIREGGAIRDDKNKLKNFSNQIFTINMVFTAISYILLAILLSFSKRLYAYKELIIIQSFIIFATTIGIEWLFSIYEDYAYITVRTIAIQFIALCAMFLCVRKEDDYLRYALISVLASGGGYIVNYFYSHKYFSVRLTKKVEWTKHLKPMLILFFNTLAITIYVNSDITILGILKGDYYVGIYSVSVKIYTILKQIVNALLVSSLPRLSYYVATDRKDNYQDLLNKILRALLLVLMPMVAGIIMLSPDIVVLVSGKAFEQSYASLQILSVAIAFSLIAAFFSSGVLLPNKKDRKILTATIISAIVNLSLNFILIPVCNEKGAALTTVLAEVTVMGIGMYYSKDIFKISNVRKTVMEGCIGIAGIVILCKIVNANINSMILRLSLAIFVSVIYYVVVLWGFKEQLFMDVINVIKQKVKREK